MVGFGFTTFDDDDDDDDDGDEGWGEEQSMRKMVERSSGGSLLIGTWVEMLWARLDRICSEGGFGLRRRAADRFGLRVVVDDGGDRRFGLDWDLRASLCAAAADDSVSVFGFGVVTFGFDVEDDGMNDTLPTGVGRGR